MEGERMITLRVFVTRDARHWGRDSCDRRTLQKVHDVVPFLGMRRRHSIDVSRNTILHFHDFRSCTSSGLAGVLVLPGEALFDSHPLRDPRAMGLDSLPVIITSKNSAVLSFGHRKDHS